MEAHLKSGQLVALVLGKVVSTMEWNGEVRPERVGPERDAPEGDGPEREDPERGDQLERAGVQLAHYIPISSAHT